MKRGLLAIFLAIAMVACDRGPDDEARRRLLAEHVRTAVEKNAIELPFSSADEARELAELRRRFYDARGFAPAWLEGKIKPAAGELVAALAMARHHALDPGRYGGEGIARMLGELDEDSLDDTPVATLARVDAILTASYLRYAADLTAGATRVEARKLGWAEPKLPDDFLVKMDQAIGAGLGRVLEELATQHHDYERTRAALERNPQLARTLERLRWLPADLGARHVVVNIPDFRLQAVEDGEVRLDVRVAVGKPDWPTPGLSSAIERVVLNPKWNVPEEIAKQEILPRVTEDPDGAAADGIIVLDDDEEHPRVVQEPGPKNPLGRLQFRFPNRHSIYLHDTPAGKVFARDDRGVSHGCIRVEQPVELAAFLLGAPWDPLALRGAIEAGERKGVELPSPVPVHIVYWTAWLDRAGTLQVRDDLYGEDAAMAKLLEGGAEPVLRRAGSEA